MDDEWGFYKLQEVIQTSTVALYEEQFRRLQSLVAAKYTDLDESYFTQCCIYGFIPEIQKFVKFCSPVSLEACFRLARMKERLLNMSKASIPEPSSSHKVTPSSYDLNECPAVSIGGTTVEDYESVLANTSDTVVVEEDDSGLDITSVSETLYYDSEAQSGATNERVICSLDNPLIKDDMSVVDQQNEALVVPNIVLSQTVSEVVATSEKFADNDCWLLLYQKDLCQMILSSKLLAFKGGTYKLPHLHSEDSFGLSSSRRHILTGAVSSILQLPSCKSVSRYVTLPICYEVGAWATRCFDPGIIYHNVNFAGYSLCQQWTQNDKVIPYTKVLCADCILISGRLPDVQTVRYHFIHSQFPVYYSMEKENIGIYNMPIYIGIASVVLVGYIWRYRVTVDSSDAYVVLVFDSAALEKSMKADVTVKSVRSLWMFRVAVVFSNYRFVKVFYATADCGIMFQLKITQIQQFVWIDLTQSLIVLFQVLNIFELRGKQQKELVSNRGPTLYLLPILPSSARSVYLMQGCAILFQCAHPTGSHSAGYFFHERSESIHVRASSWWTKVCEDLEVPASPVIPEYGSLKGSRFSCIQFEEWPQPEITHAIFSYSQQTSVPSLSFSSVNSLDQNITETYNDCYTTSYVVYPAPRVYSNHYLNGLGQCKASPIPTAKITTVQSKIFASFISESEVQNPSTFPKYISLQVYLVFPQIQAMQISGVLAVGVHEYSVHKFRFAASFISLLQCGTGEFNASFSYHRHRTSAVNRVSFLVVTAAESSCYKRTIDNTYWVSTLDHITLAANCQRHASCFASKGFCGGYILLVTAARHLWTGMIRPTQMASLGSKWWHFQDSHSLSSGFCCTLAVLVTAPQIFDPGICYIEVCILVKMICIMDYVSHHHSIVLLKVTWTVQFGSKGRFTDIALGIGVTRQMFLSPYMGICSEINQLGQWLLWIVGIGYLGAQLVRGEGSLPKFLWKRVGADNIQSLLGAVSQICMQCSCTTIQEITYTWSCSLRIYEVFVLHRVTLPAHHQTSYVKNNTGMSINDCYKMIIIITMVRLHLSENLLNFRMMLLSSSVINNLCLLDDPVMWKIAWKVILTTLLCHHAVRLFCMTNA